MAGGEPRNFIIYRGKSLMTTVISGTQIFDSMLEGIDYPADSEAGKLYPFKVRVGCVKRRPPRHKFFSYILDMGQSNIDKIFNEGPFNSNSLSFVFPERWMGVAEQQAFMYCLKQHPQANKLIQVDIITSSPLLIGDFMREQIRIISWDDDDNYIGGN